LETAAAIGGGHNRINRLRCKRGVNRFANRPSVIGQALPDRWRAAQAFMNVAEVVVRDVQADCRSMVVEFLGEAIGEPREAAAGASTHSPGAVRMSEAANQATKRKELPPSANAIYASVCIASHVMTDSSAGDGARAEHDTGPCDTTRRVPHVRAVDHRTRLLGAGSAETCDHQRSQND
jgi:hypothetical protein